MDTFRVPTSMTPDELGDHLAQLVWESFTDFLGHDDTEIGIGDLGIETEDGIPHEDAVEESLIFLMWAHTRAAQLAFIGRAQDDVLRQGLDAMHRAVFEDLVQNGTPEKQLPLFEQRISARYAEYHRVAQDSNDAIAGAVLRHLAHDLQHSPEAKQAMADRALSVATPLKDFLEDVELVGG